MTCKYITVTRLGPNKILSSLHRVLNIRFFDRFFKFRGLKLTHNSFFIPKNHLDTFTKAKLIINSMKFVVITCISYTEMISFVVQINRISGFWRHPWLVHFCIIFNSQDKQIKALNFVSKKVWKEIYLQIRGTSKKKSHHPCNHFGSFHLHLMGNLKKKKEPKKFYKS